MQHLRRRCGSRSQARSGQAGFTLIESIFAAAILGLAAVAIMGVQKNIFATQTVGRDQLVGTEIVQACAERLLAVRRNSGYANVTGTLCTGMGGVGGFAANPTVVMRSASAAVITTCSTATCTATITIAKTSGPAVPSGNVTLQMSNY